MTVHPLGMEVTAEKQRVDITLDMRERGEMDSCKYVTLASFPEPYRYPWQEQLLAESSALCISWTVCSKQMIVRWRSCMDSKKMQARTQDPSTISLPSYSDFACSSEWLCFLLTDDCGVPQLVMTYEQGAAALSRVSCPSCFHLCYHLSRLPATATNN